VNVARPLTLAGIFAHPDDETWSLAGTFALLVPKGVRDVTRKLVEHRDNWREVFAVASYVRVHPAPQAEDPPEPSLLEAFDG
jgi:hypothetical protein